MSGSSKRHIVFIGETGSGKSSAINLLLGTASAPVNNDSQPCTDTSIPYNTTLYGTTYCLWDSRGLGEGRNFFQTLFGASSEKGLKKLLKERHSRQEIDLVVFCIRGSRATEAARDYHRKFCSPTRRLAAPVVVMVTQLEKEKDMEEWWRRNCLRLGELGLEFDDHVCVTTLAEHPRLAESREKLVDVITRYRRWEPEDSGSYFGSPVQKKIATSAPQRKGGIWGLFKATGTTNVSNESRRPSNYPASTVPSITESSYHTADSPVESTLPSPVVEPPTPGSTITVKLPPINTQLLEVDQRPQSSGEDTSSGSSLSMFHPSPDSSCTSCSEVYLESCAEENKDSPTELPFKLSTSTVRRRRSWASYGGGFGDVWECDLISGESTRIVAVKAVRININSNGYKDLRPYEKKLRRELKIWGRLRHRNVVPLLGVVSGFGPLPSAVSPWFCKGSLSCYLAYHLSMSQKHRLLGDIAVGLCYIHSQDVVHGDLHSGNVLIDDDGTACLTDFGLSFINDFVGTSYLKSSICGGVNFADPALVKRAYDPQNNAIYPTKPCDIYSFGGLMLHVLSGKKPYDGIPQPNIVMTVMKGERPQMPTHDEHITHWHKSLIRACWAQEERRRPPADDLVRSFDRQ